MVFKRSGGFNLLKNVRYIFIWNLWGEIKSICSPIVQVHSWRKECDWERHLRKDSRRFSKRWLLTIPSILTHHPKFAPMILSMPTKQTPTIPVGMLPQSINVSPHLQKDLSPGTFQSPISYLNYYTFKANHITIFWIVYIQLLKIVSVIFISPTLNDSKLCKRLGKTTSSQHPRPT